MSDRDYRTAPGVRASQLKAAWQRSAAHAYAERATTDAMREGTAIHAAILEPDVYSATYAVRPDAPAGLVATIDDAKAVLGTVAGASKWRADDWFGACEAAGIPTARQWRAEVDAALIGRELLTAADDARYRAIAHAVRHEHPTTAGLFAEGLAETPYYAAIDGIAAKCLADWICTVDGRPSAIVDVKTTRDASPSGFARECATRGYHLQAAWYVDVVHAATGLDLPFVFVAVEAVGVAPVDGIAVYLADHDTINAGRGAYRRTLAILRAADESGRLGYPTATALLRLPRWALTETT